MVESNKEHEAAEKEALDNASKFWDTPTPQYSRPPSFEGDELQFYADVYTGQFQVSGMSGYENGNRSGSAAKRTSKRSRSSLQAYFAHIWEGMWDGRTPLPGATQEELDAAFPVGL